MDSSSAVSLMEKDLKGLESELEGMRDYFRNGKTKDGEWRKVQLKGLLSFLKEKETEIFQALMEDLGKPDVEAYRDEVCFCFSSWLFFDLGSVYEFCLWLSGRDIGQVCEFCFERVEGVDVK